MQCPECGVFCAVPVGAAAPAREKKRAPVAPPIDAAETATLAAVPSPAPHPPAPRPTLPLRREKRDDRLTTAPGFTACPHCGELVRKPPRRRGQARLCPLCGADWAEPVKASPPSVPLPPVRNVNEALIAPDEDPETSNPYRVDDAGRRICPGCNDALAPDAVFCNHCGYDMRTGAKVEKRFRPIDLSWDSGLPFQWRLIAFAGAMGAALIVFGGFSLFYNGEFLPFVLSWMFFGALMSFLFGTYDRLELRRNRSGRVTLLKRWRFCFVPSKTYDVDVYHYQGVATGRAHNAGCWEWTVLLFLLPPGIVPAAIWWYFAMYRIVYFVALSSEHGFPELYLYRGWSEPRMEEVARLVRDAVGYTTPAA
jgi:hypothetical protein